jgi:hypothetical protein
MNPISFSNTQPYGAMNGGGFLNNSAPTSQVANPPRFMNTSRAKKRHRPLFFKNIFGSFGKAKKSKGAILSPPPSRMPQQSSPSRMPYLKMK